MQHSEKTIYYNIIVKCWTTFSKERTYAEFSDDWWSEIIAEFNTILNEYRGTEYQPLVDTLVMRLLDQQERRQKEWKQGQ